MQIQDEACFVTSEKEYPTPHLDLELDTITITSEKTPRIDFISQLPIELAIYILLNIGDHPQTLVRCRLVSQHWRQCAEDPIVWRENFLAKPQWRVKHLYPQQKEQEQQNEEDEEEAEDDQFDPFHSSFNPVRRAISRQNSIQSYRSNGSANKHVARRLSQLLFEPSLTSAPTIPSDKNQENILDAECLISLDWLKLYRDRFILDRRWSDGKQTTRSLKGHKDSIYCLQLNGDQIITGSRDRTIKTWDMKTGACTNTLTGHKGSVLCVRCEGKTMLTGSSDCQVFVWEEGEGPSGTWDVKHKLIGHQSGVLDLGLDDKYIVSSSKDATIRIWNREDGGIVRTITGHAGPVNALELCRNPLQRIETTTDHTPAHLTTGLLTASGDSSMKLWELETGRLVRTFEGHIRGLACLKLVEAENLVVTGSNDETIKFWNLATGQCLKTLLGHSGLVRSLDIDLAQNRLVSGSYDKTIKVWDLDTGDIKLDFRKGERKLVFDIKVHLTSIVSVGYDSSIMVLDFSCGLDCDNFL